MLSVKQNQKGRFGNKFIRNMIIYLVNQKVNIIPIYEIDNEDQIDSFNKLGLKFKNNKIDDSLKKEKITSKKIIQILNNEIKINLDKNYTLDGFYQNHEIIKIIYEYLNNLNNNISLDIISCNPYKYRYNNNNDIFIHLRAGDIFNYNSKNIRPNLNYFESIINYIKDYKNIYIASDNFNNSMCDFLIKKYNIIKYEKDKINTIQFGSTCKYVILSSGSFSLVISLSLIHI